MIFIVVGRIALRAIFHAFGCGARNRGRFISAFYGNAARTSEGLGWFEGGGKDREGEDFRDTCIDWCKVSYNCFHVDVVGDDDDDDKFEDDDDDGNNYDTNCSDVGEKNIMNFVFSWCYNFWINIRIWMYFP